MLQFTAPPFTSRRQSEPPFITQDRASLSSETKKRMNQKRITGRKKKNTERERGEKTKKALGRKKEEEKVKVGL